MTQIRSCMVSAVRYCGEVTGWYKACDRCCNQVLRWLGEIEADYIRLDPAPEVRHGLGGGGGSGKPGSRSPARDHVLAMLDPRTARNGCGPDDQADGPIGVAAAVGEWSRYVWENQPDTQFPATVGDGFVFLRRWTDWLMTQDCAGDFADEMRRIRDQLRSHAEPVRKVAECPVEIAKGIRCEAPLRMSADDRVIRCWACGAWWERPWTELITLGALVSLMDYATLSDWLAVPVGTLWYWNSVDRWTRGGTKGRPLWTPVEVLESYQKRREKKAG